MYGILGFFTVLSALMPFLWISVPPALIALSLQEDSQRMVLMLAGAGVLGALGVFLLSFLRGNYRMRMNAVRYHLLQTVLEASLQMPFHYTLRKERLEELERANQAVLSPFQGAGGFMLKVLDLPGILISLLAMTGLFTWLSPQMMLFMAFITAVHLGLNILRAKVQEEEVQQAIPTELKIRHLTREIQDPLGRKDLMMYQFFPLFQEYTQGWMRDLTELVQVFSKKQIRLQVFLALAGFLKDLVVFWILIRRVLNGSLNAASFLFYVGLTQSFLLLSAQLMELVTEVKADAARFVPYLNFLKERENWQESACALALPEGPWTIQWEDVSFSYPEGDRPVLDHFNLTIRAGETLALVGDNGSGKSTLVLLLCRLYPPTKGRILINGVDLWSLDEEAFRAHIAAVFQDASLFPFTLAENIAFSKEIDAMCLQESMEASGLSQVAAHYPKGADTPLLRVFFNDGVDLSGGQRQKLYLARALYKKQSSLLILDEPTAALDPLAESALYQKFASLTQGKTGLFISHRLASTAFCDRIAYLENGAIREEGTHEELMARKGAYYERYTLQARHYQEVTP